MRSVIAMFIISHRLLRIYAYFNDFMHFNNFSKIQVHANLFISKAIYNNRTTT